MKQLSLVIIFIVFFIGSYAQSYTLVEVVKRIENTNQIEYVKEYHENEIKSLDINIGYKLVIINYINSLSEICGKEIVRVEKECPTVDANNTIFGINTQGEHILISFLKNKMLLIDYPNSYNEEDIYQSMFFY